MCCHIREELGHGLYQPGALPSLSLRQKQQTPVTQSRTFQAWTERGWAGPAALWQVSRFQR